MAKSLCLMSKISVKMQQRIDRIEAVIREGCSLEIVWGIFPRLVSSSGSVKTISVVNTRGSFSGPAGFSWVGLFFPMVVFTQIKRWSYFLYLSLLTFAVSLAEAYLGWHLSFAVNLGFGLVCGCSYPYLRYVSLKDGVACFPLVASILLGILFSLLAILPSVLLEAAVSVK